MKSTVALVLLTALIVTNVVWAYIYFDRLGALDHRSDEVSRQRRISEQLASMLLDLPRDRGIQETLNYMKRRHPALIVKSEADTLHAGDIILEFKDRSLSRIRF
jgi:hypothetical protein